MAPIWALMLASVNCLLTFYLKGNTGLPPLVMMAATLGIAFIWPVRQSRRFLAVFSAVFILALVGLSWPLRTDLPGYIVGEMHLANAYNDAMFLPVSLNPMGVQTLSMAVTIALAFIAVGVFSAQSFRRDRTALVIYLLAALPVYLLFKNGFVRADNHIRLFFLTVPAALGVAALLIPAPVNRRLALVTASCTGLFIPVRRPALSPVAPEGKDRRPGTVCGQPAGP